MKTTKPINSTAPIFQQEFGPDFTVPLPIIEALNAGLLRDISWHNNTCPSFALAAEQQDGRELWVDHPDKTKREFPSSPRLNIVQGEESLWLSEFDEDAQLAINQLSTH